MSEIRFIDPNSFALFMAALHNDMLHDFTQGDIKNHWDDFIEDVQEKTEIDDLGNDVDKILEEIKDKTGTSEERFMKYCNTMNKPIIFHSLVAYIDPSNLHFITKFDFDEVKRIQTPGSKIIRLFSQNEPYREYDLKYNDNAKQIRVTEFSTDRQPAAPTTVSYSKDEANTEYSNCYMVVQHEGMEVIHNGNHCKWENSILTILETREPDNTLLNLVSFKPPFVYIGKSFSTAANMDNLAEFFDKKDIRKKIFLEDTGKAKSRLFYIPTYENYEDYVREMAEFNIGSINDAQIDQACIFADSTNSSKLIINTMMDDSLIYSCRNIAQTYDAGGAGLDKRHILVLSDSKYRSFKCNRFSVEYRDEITNTADPAHNEYDLKSKGIEMNYNFGGLGNTAVSSWKDRVRGDLRVDLEDKSASKDNIEKWLDEHQIRTRSDQIWVRLCKTMGDVGQIAICKKFSMLNPLKKVWFLTSDRMCAYIAALFGLKVIMTTREGKTMIYTGKKNPIALSAMAFGTKIEKEDFIHNFLSFGYGLNFGANTPPPTEEDSDEEGPAEIDPVKIGLIDKQKAIDCVLSNNLYKYGEPVDNSYMFQYNLVSAYFYNQHLREEREEDLFGPYIQQHLGSISEFIQSEKAPDVAAGANILMGLSEKAGAPVRIEDAPEVPEVPEVPKRYQPPTRHIAAAVAAVEEEQAAIKEDDTELTEIEQQLPSNTVRPIPQPAVAAAGSARGVAQQLSLASDISEDDQTPQSSPLNSPKAGAFQSPTAGTHLSQEQRTRTDPNAPRPDPESAIVRPSRIRTISQDFSRQLKAADEMDAVSSPLSIPDSGDATAAMLERRAVSRTQNPVPGYANPVVTKEEQDKGITVPQTRKRGRNFDFGFNFEYSDSDTDTDTDSD